MRAVEVRVTPADGWFGPFHRQVAETRGLGLETLHELRLLADGSVVLLYEFTGDRAAAERLAADHLEGADVDWQLADEDGRHLVYANAEPTDLTAAVLELLDEWRVVVDWPVRLTGERTFRVTLVGDEAEISGLLEAVPDDVRVRVDRTGAFRPDGTRPLSRLTARERETLRAAVELGYYRNPREARYADVAEAVGCSAGTVGHHLRNAETKVMDALLGDASRP